jgi:hypothetical protein
MVLATDEPDDEDRAAYDEVVPLPPPWETEATLAALRRVRFDVLVAQTEYGLLPGALLAQERGLPGPEVRGSFLTVNKWLGRRAMAAAGVPQPRFALCSGATDVRRADLGFPVVLKPVASTLGRLVRKVETDAELDGAVEALLRALPSAPDVLRCADFARVAGLDPGCAPTRQFLAEAFAEGPPTETDGLVFGTTVDVFGTTAQIVSPPPCFYIEAYLFPVRDGGRHEAISRAAVGALGLRDAGFSIEFRGETVIEVNGRLGEDAGFPQLFEAGLGKAPILKWIERDATPSAPRGAHALAYRNRYAPGTVRAVRGAAGATLVVAPGRRLGEPGTPGFYPHLAYALASHEDDLGEALARARRALEPVVVECDPS